MKTMTEAEWNAEGERLFGPDRFKWRFVCPQCGNVASVEDFRAFKEFGATTESATKECIGRYFPKTERGGWSSEHCNPDIKKPCDYAGYGLIGLSPVRIERGGEKLTKCFAFAEPDTSVEAA